MADQNMHDPWLDDQFGGVDFSADREPLMDTLSSIAEEENIEIPGADPAPQPAPAAPAAAAPEPVAPEPPAPQVFEYDDGSSVTIEKTSKGWKATLDSGIVGANAEVFYGKTKDQMWQNLAAGKINATRKIRELNKKLKLESAPAPAPAPVQQREQPLPKQLTADDVFALKTKLAANPDQALEDWFKKRFGMSVDEMVEDLQRGRSAQEELTTEKEARAFLQRHPEYYSIDENYFAMVKWLAKYKIGRVLTESNREEVITQLVRSGHFTAANLEEAYEDLRSSGLLEMSPDSAEEEEAEEPAPQPVQRAVATPPAPAPAQPVAETPTDGRIVRTVRRPRAGLGIRQTETSTGGKPPVEVRPPSVEELDNLSDDEIAQLFSGVRKHRSLSSRR